MIDWMLFWTAVMAIAAIVTILGSIFAYFRKVDGKANMDKHNITDNRITELTKDLNTKLSEAEFRRFETRHEAALLSIKASTDTRIDKLERKLDEKFDKLFDMLVDK